MKNFILKHTPDKYLPKPKVKSPRNQVCKLDKDGQIVYIMYIKITNILPISATENDGLSKYDYAGVFDTRNDAHRVADCLNKIFSWYHVYDDKYKLESPYWVTINNIGNKFIVDGYYRMIGDIKRKEFMTELILGVVTDKKDVDTYKTIFTNELPEKTKLYLKRISPKNKSKLHIEPIIHVMRYKLNDVMATMNLHDYNLTNHKQQMKIITNELYKYPHNKTMKQLIGELEYMPPTKPLKSGGVHYQNMVNDSEFKKRWKKD